MTISVGTLKHECGIVFRPLGYCVLEKDLHVNPFTLRADFGNILPTDAFSGKHFKEKY